MLQGGSFLWVFLMATAGTANFWLLSILTADLGRETVNKKQEFCDLWKTNLPSITESYAYKECWQKQISRKFLVITQILDGIVTHKSFWVTLKLMSISAKI